MTRYLSTDGFGSFTTITAFLQFFGYLADLGLYVVTIQLLSEVNANVQRNFENAFAYRMITATILIFCAPLVALFFPYPAEIKWGIALTALSYWCSSFIQFFTAVFQTHVRMTIPSIADIVSKVVMIAALVCAVFFNWGLGGVLAALIISNIIQLAIMIVFITPYVRLRLRFDWDVWHTILVRSWPIALSIMLNLIYLKADTIILSVIKSPEEVGLYGAAYRVVEVLIALPFLFVGLTLSSFTRAWSSHDHESFKRYYQKSFDFMVMCAVPLIVGAFFVADDGMVLLSGESFALSGGILRVLMIAGAAVFLSALFGNLINIIGKQRMMVFGYLTSAVIGLIGYFAFIPRYSYWGAAWMTVVTEIIIVVVSWTIVARTTRIHLNMCISFKILLAATLMTLILQVSAPYHVVIRIIAACIVYGSALIVLGAIPRHYYEHFLSPKHT